MSTIDKNNPLLWIGLGGAALVATSLLTYVKIQTMNKPQTPLEPILNPLVVRQDKGGSGWFGSARTDHVHQGTDFVCRPGQQVYAPFAGVIVRSAKPYADDLQWNGLLLRSDLDGYECKLFYCTLTTDVNQHVERGQLIAFAQGISNKYSSGVTDHIHVEIRQNGKVLNPENLWRWAPPEGQLA